MRLNRLYGATALMAGCLTFTINSSANAQDTAQDVYADEELDEVVVTGTYLRGKTQASSPSPLTVIGADNLNEIGATNFANLVQTLTINNGAQNNPDAFTQNSTTGTSNFNLRGLGVASTLVLLNGRRQVNSGTVTNDGVTFVDTSSLIPMIATQRIEIVKDGAAAIYGTDAVAGVVNFITDDDFRGIATSVNYQFLTDEGSQEDFLAQVKLGWGNDRQSLMGAFSFYDRSPLTTSERRLSRPEDDSSALGNPGSFIGTGAFNLPAGVPFIDPTGCEEFGGIPQPLGAPAGGLTPGFCRFDFGDFFNLVPEEQRIQGYGVFKQQIGDAHEFRIEGAFALNEAERGNSPTFPFLQSDRAVVPTDHPSNPFGEPVIFFGRGIGNGGQTSPAPFESDTYRISATLNGELTGEWTYDVNYTHAWNDFFQSTEDTITDNFSLALQGLGGFNCDVAAGTPGQNGCLYYNPFATSFGALPNDPEVIDFIIGEQLIDGRSELSTFEAIVSGPLFDLPAGTVELAVGFQYRDETFSRDFDDIANADGFAFVIGSPDFEGERTANAWFMETLIPLHETLDLSFAVRHEDYGGSIGSTTDPKVSLLFRPTETLTLRGSYSTSFRAPSIFQLAGASTSLNQVLDPVTGSQFFAAVRTNPPEGVERDLLPEQSEAFNVGFTWQPVDGLDINVDYWNYDFSDVLIQENFQAVVDADPTGDRVIRNASGNILLVLTDFINASSVQTDGFDFNVRYAIDTDIGTFQPFFEGTWVNSYDLLNAQGEDVIDGKGNRNFTNFGAPTPEWRFNTGLAFTDGTHEGRFFVRHISGLDDDQNGGIPIDSMTTVDAQYRLNVANLFDFDSDLGFTVGVINAFDEDPPQVFTNGGFESRTHDPRGRVLYLQLDTSF
ncbi:TonB-dependent receptor plug domain-containing protein [Eilatimonas milleporae]|uniref:TonB-dependent receptor-like protein n=1 Tax=Eilatimonas milleporae TaxID=911205 RepID=A0A3M0BWQ2_9PROT|nr:TonB-dependent receptor [Eilatimonas milleporae]RMB02021.1 TonB-dependent receptor-like protein [Eilatimonas milleporae]